MPYCLIFPGQGTQFVGMARGLNFKYPVDRGLVDLMEKGPEDELMRTVNAQQAVFAVTEALWSESGFDKPEMVMGHSLGEYMALVAAGVVSSGDCMSVVKNRAVFMEQASPDGKGVMAAVLGLTYQKVSEAIHEMPDVWVANINEARQIVIAGSSRSVQEAGPVLKEMGARRIVPLRVSVASHCPYMEPARSALGLYLKGVNMGRPVTRIVFNATAQEETDPDRIRVLLADQLVSPVRWEESVLHAARAGIRHFVEIGPKSVLASLVKRIVPGAQVEVVTQNEH